MIRRRHTRSLVRSDEGHDEDVNPNSYLVNITDCMLVLVVGLLVALVVHYGVDLSGSSEETQGTEVTMDQNSDGQIDSRYSEAGKVYKDEATGKYYMVQDS